MMERSVIFIVDVLYIISFFFFFFFTFYAFPMFNVQGNLGSNFCKIVTVYYIFRNCSFHYTATMDKNILTVLHVSLIILARPFLKKDFKVFDQSMYTRKFQIILNRCFDYHCYVTLRFVKYFAIYVYKHE